MDIITYMLLDEDAYEVIVSIYRRKYKRTNSYARAGKSPSLIRLSRATDNFPKEDVEYRWEKGLVKVFINYA